MKKQLINQLKKAAKEINDKNKTYGKFALQKVSVISEETEMSVLIQVGEDLVLIASKI